MHRSYPCGVPVTVLPPPERSSMAEQHEKLEAQAGRVIVWGLAAGKGTTQEAAAGALAWRHYPDRQTIPRDDWQVILFVRDD